MFRPSLRPEVHHTLAIVPRQRQRSSWRRSELIGSRQDSLSKPEGRARDSFVGLMLIHDTDIELEYATLVKVLSVFKVVGLRVLVERGSKVRMLLTQTRWKDAGERGSEPGVQAVKPLMVSSMYLLASLHGVA